MTGRLRALLFFVAVALSAPALGAGAMSDAECEEYLQSVREQADVSHEMHQLLAAVSHPYYLIPGAWFLSLQALLEFSNPAALITHGKQKVAVTALNWFSLPDPKKCAATRSLKQQFEKELGVFGGNFLFYHYTSHHSTLVIEHIATKLESEAEQPD